MYLEFAVDTDSRLTTCTANFFLVRAVSVTIFNSKFYNGLNKLLFGDKANRGCDIKKLPIPILDEQQQRIMERLVDSEHYDEIEMLLVEIFQL